MEQGSIINAAEIIRHVASAVVHQSVMRSKYGSITLFAIDDEESITEHKSSSDEFIYVIDGMVELILNEVPIILKKGESQHITPNTLHIVKGVRSGKIMLVIIRNID